MIENLPSSDTSVLTATTRRNIPEDSTNLYLMIILRSLIADFTSPLSNWLLFSAYIYIHTYIHTFRGSELVKMTVGYGVVIQPQRYIHRTTEAFQI
jgi:hypothetical protein